MRASFPKAFGTEHEYVTLVTAGDFDEERRRDEEYKIAVELLDAFWKRFFNKNELRFGVVGEIYKFLRRCLPEKNKEICPFGSSRGFMTPLGSRFYIDHGYFEGSTGESADPCEHLEVQTAQDELIAEVFGECFGDDLRLPRLYKNISDGFGHSQAAHRNFCISPDLWKKIASVSTNPVKEQWLLATWHAVEQILTGAGKYGIEFVKNFKQDGYFEDRNFFQISGRADFLEDLVNEHTTRRRPLINSRDEPLADGEKYARYHCICGDANMAEWPHLFKMGLMAILLSMLEDDALEIDYAMSDPVSAVKQISRDPGLRLPVEIFDWRTGEKSSKMPLDILGDFLAAMERYSVSRSVPGWCYPIIDKARWCVAAFRENSGALGRVLDWKIKERVIGSRRNPFGKHLNYHALWNPKAMLYRLLVERGEVETVASREKINFFKKNPPETTRAYTRGRLIGAFPGLIDIHVTSWKAVWLKGEDNSWIKVSTEDPSRLTKAECAHIFEVSGGPSLRVLDKLS